MVVAWLNMKFLVEYIFFLRTLRKALFQCLKAISVANTSLIVLFTLPGTF